MKNYNNKKRWFYDLTEKQVYKIVTVFEVMFFIIAVSCIVTNWPNEQLLAQIGMDLAGGIVLMFCFMIALGILILEILWINPKKQFYLFWKEHDEKIVPKVREKFGLSSDFKEVLSKVEEEQSLHCYAKETEEGILISLRDETGEELKSKLIKNYDSFDLNYEPKV